MRRAQSNHLLRRRLVLVALLMGLFGFLLVPFYDAICEATGINRLLSRDVVDEDLVISEARSIPILFDASTALEGVTFVPIEVPASVHPGEFVRATYLVRNMGEKTLFAQAVPSYLPKRAGRYVKKLDCFCFDIQSFEPGSEVELPVVFVLDPKIPQDIQQVALSYALFEVDGR